jgi:hypothetical protein
MKPYNCIKLELIERHNHIPYLAVILMICAVFSGCSHNRASIVTRQPTGTPIKVSDVKLVSSFKDINGPWRLEGSISAYVVPLFKNNAENRETYVKETAAEHGINTVVGLMPDIGEVLGGPNHAHGIMANTSFAQEQNAEPLPKFIVCLPPVNFKIEKTPALSKLDEYIREYAQYILGYGRGYYAYRSNAAGVDNNSILQGSASMEALSEPIGIEPDYAFLFDVDGYNVEGNIIINRTHTLKLSMTLYDFKEKKPVWTRSTEGISSKSILAGLLMGVVGIGMELEPKDDLTSVSRAVDNAIKELPAVKGFKQGGGCFPIYAE